MLSRTARIVVAAAFAATSLVACSNEQAKEDFIAAADAVCREADQRIAELRPRVEERVRAYVERAEEISADLVRDLKELEPPQGDEGEIDALIDELQRATNLLEPLLRASVDRDTEGIERLQEEVREVTDDVTGLAKSYGFEVCGAKVVEPSR